MGVECLPYKQGVVGSMPTGTTKNMKKYLDKKYKRSKELRKIAKLIESQLIDPIKNYLKYFGNKK